MKFFKKLFISVFLIFMSTGLVFAERTTKTGKVVFLGNKGTGKSSFIDALIYGQKADGNKRAGSKKIEQTLQYTVQHDDENVTINLTLQDYPGDEDLYNTIKQYYRDAHFVFVFVRLDKEIDKKSHINRWINDVKELNKYKKDRIVITLVGTMLDLMTGTAKHDHFLLNENRGIIKQSQENCDFNIKYIEVSNNDPASVKEQFDKIIKDSYLRVMPILSDERGQFGQGCIDLTPPTEEKKTGGSCCVLV